MHLDPYLPSTISLRVILSSSYMKVTIRYGLSQVDYFCLYVEHNNILVASNQCGLTLHFYSTYANSNEGICV